MPPDLSQRSHHMRDATGAPRRRVGQIAKGRKGRKKYDKIQQTADEFSTMEVSLKHGLRNKGEAIQYISRGFMLRHITSHGVPYCRIVQKDTVCEGKLSGN